MLTNKYAEGYPGRRYYGGCQYVDIAETLAIERVNKLFGCDFANVQPHSGAQANAGAVPGAAAARRHLPGPQPRGRRPSDAWLARSTCRASGSSRCPIACGATTSRIDMDEVAQACARAQAEGDHRRRLGLSARSSTSRRFREIADEVGAKLMVDMAHFAGLVAGGVHPTPGAACPCHHHDHAQDAARPARRHDPDQRRGHSPRRSTRRCSPASRAAR